MDGIGILKNQIVSARSIMLSTLEGTTQEQAQWLPEGDANSIAATYAHLILSEDVSIGRWLKEGEPLSETEFAGKTGISSMPPNGEGARNWGEWAKTVRVDLDAAAKYYQAVAAATDAYVSGLSAADLDRELPTTSEYNTLSKFLGLGATHTAMHAGEISACKGMQGLRGYAV